MSHTICGIILYNLPYTILVGSLWRPSIGLPLLPWEELREGSIGNFCESQFTRPNSENPAKMDIYPKLGFLLATYFNWWSFLLLAFVSGSLSSGCAGHQQWPRHQAISQVPHLWFVMCMSHHEPTMAEWPASTKETAWLFGRASLPGTWCISDAKVCFRAQLLRFSCTGDDPCVWYLWAYFHRWHWCSTAIFKVLWLDVVSFEYSPNN